MRILLALDGSRYSQSVVSLIASLNIDSKVESTALTVIPEHMFLGRHTLSAFMKRSAAPDVKAKLVEEEKAVELLAKWTQPLTTLGLRIETAVVRGNPAEEIVKTCRSVKADLVVVGAKGSSDAPEFLLGGTAQKVMKYAPCSVLVAKKGTEAVGRVLVPIDGSRYSDETVRFLLRMPIPHHSEVILMTVAESFKEWLVEAPTMDVEENLQIVGELQKAEEEAAKRLMAEPRQDFRTAKYKVSTTIAYGDASRQILQATKEQEVDLIALGAKGLTGIRSFLLGSVAQRVAKYSESSVLLVRPPKGGK